MFTEEVIINILHEKFNTELTYIDIICDGNWLVKLKEAYSEEPMVNTSFMFLQDWLKILPSLSLLENRLQRLR
jgi:hypothetical protein